MAYCISSPWFYHLQDPGALNCCGCNDEFQKQRPMQDDRVLNIVKRVGLEGLHRTPSKEIDHNLITAFVERWRPETHTFTYHMVRRRSHYKMRRFFWGFQLMVRQLLEQLTWCRLLNVRICLELLLTMWCFKDNESRLTDYFKKQTKGSSMVQQRMLCISMHGVIFQHSQWTQFSPTSLVIGCIRCGCRC